MSNGIDWDTVLAENSELIENARKSKTKPLKESTKRIKRWKAENHDKVKAWYEDYYNRPEVKQRRKETNKLRKRRDRADPVKNEIINANRRRRYRWRMQHEPGYAESLIERNKKWRRENREKYNAYQRKKYHERKNSRVS